MTLLPTLAPSSEQDPSGLASTGKPSGPSRVLYVEDDAVNVMLMQGILELHQGSELLVARTGAEARRLVAAGAIDLVLCDLRLPDIGGDALLPELRAAGLSGAVPAVLVTAESEFVAAQLARRYGYDGHWTKPLDVAATLRSLTQWLGGR
ncbi:MAG: response regulator [Roseateles sp.]|uniref:response regulator n=1 Tax=Roseateles sp. TaxID=1971397 RepID=UPI0040372DB0